MPRGRNLSHLLYPHGLRACDRCGCCAAAAPFVAHEATRVGPPQMAECATESSAGSRSRWVCGRTARKDSLQLNRQTFGSPHPSTASPLSHPLKELAVCITSQEAPAVCARDNDRAANLRQAGTRCRKGLRLKSAPGKSGPIAWASQGIHPSWLARQSAPLGSRQNSEAHKAELRAMAQA